MQRFSTTGRFPLSRSRIVPSIGAVAGAFSAGLLFVVVSTPALNAQPPKPTEYDVKAAYLIDFGRFVRLSGQQHPHSSFDICVLGRDSFGQSLDALASNETVSSLPIHVRHPDATDSKTCAIVFISSIEQENIREDLAILGNADVLTVSDAADFLQRGGMIQFVVAENHVRFAVNLDAVSRAHLVLSSELLRVAFYVTGKPPSGGQP
jgi:hypothetical protein